MRPTSIGVLHLSDLHLGLERQGTLWPSIRDKFYEDLRKYHSVSGPWHLLLFTGDLTQRGASEEFDGVDKILGEILAELRKLGSEPLVLAVPGNHDLVRPRPQDEPHLLSTLKRWGEDPEVDELIWKEDSTASLLLKTAFQNFVQWSDRWFKKQENIFINLHRGLLPGDFSVSIPFGEHSIGIMGLNSAFLQLDGREYRGRLVIDPKQFHRACKGNDGSVWARRHTLNLLLTHHGPEWLRAASREAYEADMYVPDRFLAHLHGHTHENTQTTEARGGTQPRRVMQARSMFGLETFGEKQSRSHGYSILRLSLLGEEKCELRHWPRCASLNAGGSWSFHVDTAIEHETDSGTTPVLVRVRNPEKSLHRDAEVLADTNPPRPPRPPSKFTKHAHGEQLTLLDGEIVAARTRRENLAREKLPTQVVDEEIRTLRGRKRDGVPLEPGDRLPAMRAEYVLCDRLGYGGFGEVWKAKHSDSGHFVAIKVLHGQYARDLTMVERFSRGARVLGTLSHPNIVPLVEPYQQVNGYHFFVMQFIDGPTLDELVTAEDFAPEQIPSIVRMICEAVAHAHDSGFIHRDIKPSNVIFSSVDHLYLTDFDLVKFAETSGGTRQNNPMGSISFAAPEQFTAPDAVTEAADVCSIARCVLFMYLRENPPIETASAPGRVVRRISATDAIRDVIKKGCQPNPKLRHKSVREFVEAFLESLTAKDSGERHVLVRVLSDHPLTIIQIPEGEFTMGTPGDLDDEFPHIVRISAFGIGETAVTEGQWRIVMSTHPNSHLYMGEAQLPVVGVSWSDAIRFLNRLSELQGLQPCYRWSERDITWDPLADGFRLPTEAEWEYAARAGTETAYSFGETTQRLKQYAWNGKHAKGTLHPVKLLKPNPWHLYDVHGNVREWVWDWSGGYPRGEVSNPIGPEYGRYRVVRGGNYEVDPVFLRSAARGARAAESFSESVGFRVAINLKRFPGVEP